MILTKNQPQSCMVLLEYCQAWLTISAPDLTTDSIPWGLVKAGEDIRIQ